MWGGLKGPLEAAGGRVEGPMAMIRDEVEREMGPAWLRAGGMGVGPMPKAVEPKLADDLSRLTSEVEGLEGEVKGLADVLRPILTNLSQTPRTPDPIGEPIPPAEGRSQFSVVVLSAAGRIRELRELVWALGRAVEL